MTTVADFVVPPVGEPIDSARLVRWLVMPGQPFRAGDVVVEIETDKSIVEVPAPRDGVMVEHLVGVDGLLNADTSIARIQSDADDRCDAPKDQAFASTDVEQPAKPAERTGKPLGEEGAVAATGPRAASALGSRTFATPAARKLAAERGVSMNAVTGTGPNGRVTLSDVARMAGQPSAKSVPSSAGRKEMRELTVSTSHGGVSVTIWEPETALKERTFFLIHGMFGDRNVWAGTADALVRAGFRTVALDLPCHGTTKSQVTAFGDVVGCAAEVVAKECAGTVILVGHSFGGAVAARVARTPALSVGALILIAPVGLASRIEQTFIDGMTYAESNEAILRELRRLTVTGITPSTAYVDELRRGIAARRSRIVDFCRQVSWNGVQQIDALPDLAASQGKTVVIQGRRDEIVPWEQVLNVPARVALHLLPNAGHMPQWEATTATTDIMLDALAR